ncbi:hypothetical protein DYB26_013883 [Aphanomyces astaci]|uniref:Uncharacterized protein n=1 Tax=Aphanomyces astaci TaxID=112090 RepID=A0A3R7ATV6_APHAT|nr:hypothetical protein DYB26_013883 [Aphanomyces astaci]
MSLRPATSCAALPFTQRLLGTGNFDEWFFELTSVIIASEDLTEMATHCAQVETATSMKGLRRAYKLTAWLTDNRSTDEEITRSIRNHVDELIKLEKTVIARSCALVYASLSPTATDKWPPYLGAPKAKTPWRIAVATACPQAATRRTPARSSPVRSTRTRCLKTSCFRQDGLPSHLVVVGALKADQAATVVANAMAKAAGAVEEPEHPSSTPFAKATYQAANPVTHQAAWDKAAIPATPASTTPLIATINAAVARFVSRPPATAVAQATGTATAAGLIATTVAPTKTTGATAAKAAARRAALPPTATNSMSSAVAQSDSRSLASTTTH